MYINLCPQKKKKTTHIPNCCIDDGLRQLLGNITKLALIWNTSAQHFIPPLQFPRSWRLYGRRNKRLGNIDKENDSDRKRFLVTGTYAANFKRILNFVPRTATTWITSIWYARNYNKAFCLVFAIILYRMWQTAVMKVNGRHDFFLACTMPFLSAIAVVVAAVHKARDSCKWLVDAPPGKKESRARNGLVQFVRLHFIILLISF